MDVSLLKPEIYLSGNLLLKKLMPIFIYLSHTKYVLNDTELNTDNATFLSFSFVSIPNFA